MAQQSAVPHRLVDWEAARATAVTTARVTTAGRGRGRAPLLASEMRDAVETLRACAEAAHEPVAQVSALSAAPATPAAVVDRDGWVAANLASVSSLLEPTLDVIAGRRDMTSFSGRATARAAGVEIGAVMGFLSTKVLGQFDPFMPGTDGAGRLLLVAPTIVAVERELEVDPADFRLWVCLHEETHRVQFGANPWLAGYLAEQIRALVGALGGVVGDAEGATARLTEAASRLRDVVAGRADVSDLLGVVQSPDDRARLARVTAVMSLLEGHADVVMDDVGPQVVPTVAEIRARFGRRRAGAGPVDRLLRRLLGLDLKARQYAEGAAFVRGVQAQAGMDGFARVWSSPDTLPLPEEITDPSRWVARVLG